MLTTSSNTRRPLGKPARSFPSTPSGLGFDVVGGMATFSRSMSASTLPVLFWKPWMIPFGRPVSRIATRSARFAVSGQYLSFGQT